MYLRRVDETDPYSDLELYNGATTKHIFANAGPGIGVWYSPTYMNAVIRRSNVDELNEELTLTYQDSGEQFVFYGINWAMSQEISTSGVLGRLDHVQGKLKSHTKRGAPDCAVTYSYIDAGLELGLLGSVLTSQGWLVEFDYNVNQQLTTIDVHGGGTASDPIIQKAKYTYYNSSEHAGSPGTDGDLIQVAVYTLPSNLTAIPSSGNGAIARVTQYRYHQDGGEYGNAHQLAYVFEPDAVERAIAGITGASDPEDLLDVSEAAIKSYASRKFTYYVDIDENSGAGDGEADEADTSSIVTPFSSGSESLEARYGGASLNEFDATNQLGLVKTETVTGACSSCSSSLSGGVEKSYFYMDLNGGMSETNATKVCRIIVEDTKDAAGIAVLRTIWGVNHWGIALRHAVLTAPNGVNASNVWCESTVLVGATNALKSQERMPSAHAGAVTSNALLQKFLNPTNGTNDRDTVNPASGVVFHYEYDNDFSDTKHCTGVCVSKGYFDGSEASGEEAKNYVSATDWGDATVDVSNEQPWLPTAKYVYPKPTSTRDDPSRIKTVGNAYDFWDDDEDGVWDDNEQLKRITTTLATIGSGSTGQNGSGVATTTEQYLDKRGRVRWTVDGEGYIDYYTYHPTMGSQAYMVTDANPASLPDSADDTGNSDKWDISTEYNTESVDDGNGGTTNTPNEPTRDSNLPSELNLITNHLFDNQGRVTHTYSDVDPTDTAGTVGKLHVTKYFVDGTRQLPYVDGSGKPLLPSQITKVNAAGVVQETYEVLPSVADTSATSLPSSNAASLVSWTKYHYNNVNGQLEHIDRYHDIGTSGYYRTSYLYDDMGRRGATAQYVDTNKYQLNVQQYDNLGRVVANKVSVENSVPADYAAALAASTTVSETTYDSGGVGDSRVTSSKQHYTDTGDYIESIPQYTFRGHVRGVERKNNTTDFGPWTVRDLDWMGRTISSASYGTKPAWPSEYADFVTTNTDGVAGGPNTSGHFNLSVTHYDDLGRVYRTESYPGTQDTNYFQVNNYYDARGNLVATGDLYSAHQEYAYDGAGRQYQQRIVKETSGSYASGAYNYVAPEPAPTFSAMSGSSGGIIELSHSDYQANSNRVSATHRVEVNDDNSAGFSLSGGQPTGGIRQTIWHWYDGADRQIATANHGSGDTTNNTWKSTTLPGTYSPTSPYGWSTLAVRGEDVLLTTYGYDTAGRQDTVTIGTKKVGSADPETMATKTYTDDLGRRTFVVENWQSTYDPHSGIGNTAGVNRTTGFEYNGLGGVTKLIAYNGSSADAAQATEYKYLNDYNASLVTHTIYPDAAYPNPQNIDPVNVDRNAETNWSTEADQVRVEYNLDGSIARRQDQRGVEIAYGYDDARRMDAENVESYGSGSTNINQDIKSITRKYDEYGRLEYITSHDDNETSGDDGYGGVNNSNVANQIKYHYGTHGALDATYQEHDGYVSSSPSMNYTIDTSEIDNIYDDGLRVTLTQSSLVSGYKIEHYYGGATTTDNRLGRVAYTKIWGSSSFAGNTPVTTRMFYNGVSRPVGLWHYLDSGVMAATYEYDTGTDTYGDLDQFGRVKEQEWVRYTVSQSKINYSYDLAGNRLTRDVTGTSVYDQEYTYDGLNRLQSVDEGSSSTNDRYWNLDQLGNWNGVYSDDPDLGSVVTYDTRTHNSANEMTGYTYPSSNIDPVHDIAGNMTTIPQPKQLTSAYTAQYDAWNRLVELKESGTVRSKYQYDGLHRRTVRDETGGSGDLRHFYYNEQWQSLIETVDSGSGEVVDSLFNYCPHYIDAVATRITASDIHVYLHDANFNVIGVTHANNATDGRPVVERYSYSPYGEVTVLDGAVDADGTTEWDVDTDGSDIDNEFLYTGRRLDPETGLQYSRYRYYHPQLGRFVNRDPIGYFTDKNLYVYVGGQPTVSLDPDGLYERERGFKACSELLKVLDVGDGRHLVFKMINLLNDIKRDKGNASSNHKRWQNCPPEKSINKEKYRNKFINYRNEAASGCRKANQLIDCFKRLFPKYPNDLNLPGIGLPGPDGITDSDKYVSDWFDKFQDEINKRCNQQSPLWELAPAPEPVRVPQPLPMTVPIVAPEPVRVPWWWTLPLSSCECQE